MVPFAFGVTVPVVPLVLTDSTLSGSASSSESLARTLMATGASLSVVAESLLPIEALLPGVWDCGWSVGVRAGLPWGTQIGSSRPTHLLRALTQRSRPSALRPQYHCFFGPGILIPTSLGCTLAGQSAGGDSRTVPAGSRRAARSCPSDPRTPFRVPCSFTQASTGLSTSRFTTFSFDLHRDARET